ncbi:MAG TPA: MFS transporter [Caulobacteraceae bacterium]|nr:MFS transporter [Caulobacteraceae bacterium]
MLFNVIPAVLATAAGRFSLGDSQLGVVGSSFLAGFALVAVPSNLWISRFDWRATMGLGAAVGVAGLASCAAVPSYAGLLAALVASGAGLGVLYTVCIAIVSEHHRPDRAFGVKLAVEVFLAVAVLVALTTFVSAHWGFPGVVLTLAGVVGAVVLAALRWIPAGRILRPPDQRFAMARRAGTSAPFLRDCAPWLGLSGLFVSFTGMAALWAFLARLAPTFGVDERAASDVLTVGLIVSGVAGLGAAFLGDRFGRVKPLAVGMILAIAGVAALVLGHGLVAYATGAVLAAGLWNFPMAYQMGMIASADGHGRVAVLMPAALAIGGAMGPVLAGALLGGGSGYGPLYALFAAATAAGLAAFAVLGRRPIGSAVGR